MIDCSEIRPLLSAFGDGELEPPELLKVARHLAGCPDCEREAADFSALGAGLRDSYEAALNAIPLDGFAEAVQARIVQLRPSFVARFQRWLASLDDQFSPALSFASAAVAVAVLTAIVLTPYVRDYMSGRNPQIAANAYHHLNAITQEPRLPEKMLAEDSRAVISKLESENPAVAVWSEPHTDTTVIWLPDQQAGR